MSEPKTSYYKRATFVTHLPAERRYSPSHFWLENRGGDLWRVGFTKFATRMLGEIVDAQFDRTPGTSIAPGDIIGSIEGFKAISDIYCVATGQFTAANDALKSDIELVSREPYAGGWLYEFTGTPDANCGDVDSYRALLDATIDRMLAKQTDDQP